MANAKPPKKIKKIVRKVKKKVREIKTKIKKKKLDKKIPSTQRFRDADKFKHAVKEASKKNKMGKKKLNK